MITVRNRGHEALLIKHTTHPMMDEVVRPMSEQSFAGFIGGHFTIERLPAPRMDPRFDRRGGDPYNRVGARAVP